MPGNPRGGRMQGGGDGGIYIPIPELLSKLEGRLTERLERLEVKVDTALIANGREQDASERRISALEGWRAYQEDLVQRFGSLETLVRETHSKLSLHESRASHVGTQVALDNLSTRIDRLAERAEVRLERQELAIAELHTTLKVTWAALCVVGLAVSGLIFALIQANQIRLVP